MAFADNEVEQREWYKKFREDYDKLKPKIRHCSECRERCDVRFEENSMLEQNADPIQGPDGQWYCSMDCMRQDGNSN